MTFITISTKKIDLLKYLKKKYIDSLTDEQNDARKRRENQKICEMYHSICNEQPQKKKTLFK